MSSVSQNKENRAMSSVFISDITHDIGEDILKAVFSEIGQVLNFRVICDKTSNKPKIAFCEYKDPEIAVRAIHTLNGYEIKGQPIHVDLATSEKCRQEIERLQGNDEAVVEVPDPTADKAPEEISKAVASLPAEQMFELMKQMKMCIENNPQEARNLLLQNPQLAYALLQAQVIMRIVDPTVAVKILNRPATPDPNAEDKDEPTETPMDESPSPNSTEMPDVTSDSITTDMAATYPDLVSVPSSLPGPGTGIMTASGVIPGLISGQIAGLMPGLILPGMSGPQNPRISGQFSDQDLRSLVDQDLRTLPDLGDHDMRAPPAQDTDKDMRQLMGDQDFRSLGVPNNGTEARPFDPRFRNMQGTDRNVVPGIDRPRITAVDPRTAHDPRNPGAASRVEDPRKASMAASLNSRLSAAGPALQSLGSNTTQSPAGPTNAAEEQEKAALIMQVLQLTDQQIAALPPEQRQSILVLKEQLLRSQVLP